MKKIPLSQGKVALVDDADYKSLRQHRWYANKIRHIYYVQRNIQVSNSKRQPIFMHRVILNAPDGVEIDHINGNGLDNRRSNLRLCTCGENSRHQRLRLNNTTGFKGVTIAKQMPRNPYQAQIMINNKQIYLGCHQTAEAAAKVYDAAALQHHGEFALTNKMLGLL